MRNFKTKFFSILGASLLTVGLYSCNDEETNHLQQEDVKTENSAVVSKPLPPIKNEIDEMFYEYVTSDIYILSKNLTSDFIIDLNLTEEIFFQNSPQLFLWIETNLDSTMFVSLEEATNKWNVIVNVNTDLSNQFPEVYEYIANTTIGEVTFYVNKWISNTETSAAPCQVKYKQCTAKADDNFIQDVADEKSLGGSDYSCAIANHKVAMNFCNSDLRKCLNN